VSWAKQQQSGGSTPVTVADGANVTQGATTDVAVATDAPGTLNAHLRGLVKLLAAGISVSFAAAQHVIVDSVTAAVDVSDRAARLLGHVTVDSTVNPSNLDVALSTRLKPADTLAGVTTVTTVSAVTAITNALPAGTNRLGSVRLVDSADVDLTAVKGTQTARAVGIQELKDSGRQVLLLSWEEMAGTAAAESALTNFTLGTRNAANLTAASSYTVSAGKTLRIQSLSLYIKSTSTAAILARFRIRQAASGITNASPVIFDAVIGLDAATFASGQADELAVPIPDGLEVAAGQQITFTWFTNANTCTVGLALVGYEY
jgi:hypothetical protein